MGLLEKIFGDLNEKEVRKISKIVDKVEALDDEMSRLQDEDFPRKTEEYKQRLKNGETLDDLLPEAFALCREAAVRSLGMKHFRVQLIGGVVLHQGRIAEMKTGEGKTLVATLAAYLNALEGKGVHVITVNDYLAHRDAQWMGKLYNFLGLSVGCVIHSISGEERRAAYRSDITYGTNNEFGFDYLRDNMAIYEESLLQRELNYAIIDEVDSILVDEARTPLIISGEGDKSTDLYERADAFVVTLNAEDYQLEEKDKQISLTDEGVVKAEQFFGLENFGDAENMEINHHVLQALKARHLMERDVDYIVKDGEIVIVDEFTGRLMDGRRYSNGLHQAIEAKERVMVKSESKTLATITLQNYFRMYGKLSGMTGTAKTEEDEFRDIYNMDVVVIPTNKPVAREDDKDAIFSTEAGKFNALADRVKEVHETGQPVLVGTISIEKSELLSNLLKKRGVKHNVLNAKHHEKEAAIVAEAGRLGAVTIATNMAGRGTDIILGGNPEFEARRQMLKEEFTEEEISFATGFVPTSDERMLAARSRFNALHEQYKLERRPEQEQVVALGGLCIMGTERHESRRIDNQLRGRSGRQGDPGHTQFYLSMEDELMRLFGGERMQMIAKKLKVEEGEAIESTTVSKIIESAQKKVEARNFGIRKYVLQYDNVMNKQREIIYDQRKKVLLNGDLRKDIMDMMQDLVTATVEPVVLESDYPEEWNIEDLRTSLRRIVPAFDFDKMLSRQQLDLNDMNGEELKDAIVDEMEFIYSEKESEIGTERMRELERMVLLRVVDNLWMDHIDAMDQLKSGIGLRALGQQDPAAAYANEGFNMFEEMIGEIKEETVRYCYSVTISTDTERKAVVKEKSATKEDIGDGMAAGSTGNAATREVSQESRDSKQETVRRSEPKIGRNDPCPCGSGKKYKNCCGRE